MNKKKRKEKLDGTRTYVLLMCSSEHVHMIPAAKCVLDTFNDDHIWYILFYVIHVHAVRNDHFQDWGATSVRGAGRTDGLLCEACRAAV